MNASLFLLKSYFWDGFFINTNKFKRIYFELSRLNSEHLELQKDTKEALMACRFQNRILSSMAISIRNQLKRIYFAGWFLVHFILIFTVNSGWAQSSGNKNTGFSTDIKILQEKNRAISNNQKKISTDLLQLLDSSLIPKGENIEKHAETMISNGQMKPVQNANNQREKILEATVYVYIYLKPNLDKPEPKR